MEIDDIPPTEIIEGQRVIVLEGPPLPPNLGRLLAEMRVTFRADVRPGGASSICAQRDHRLARFREGRHVGPDGMVRDLRLLMCQDCEAVCVRDVSVQFAADQGRSSLQPRRKDEVLGWYTGARPNQRVYR